jgi:CheY-like chemotaxis protein
MTPTQFSLIDLESRNGLFLNQHRVTQAVYLNHGDRITVGETELYFRCPSGSVTMTESIAPKTVLMAQGDRVQGKVWREILSSQGISVVWPEKQDDLVPCLSHLQAINRLPGLMLIDLASANNNPYEFCRWCRETYPQSQIFLLSSNRTDIYDSERRWAIRQGVSELFPAFALQKLFSNIADIAVKVRHVLKVVNSPPLEHSSLVFTLLGLQEQIRNYNLD